MTITTLDESLRRLIERGSSPSAQRLELLQEARRRGIRTYASLGPLRPYLSDTEGNLSPLLWAVKDAGIDYFDVDRLNRRFGVWQSLKSVLQRHFPHLIEVYRKLLFDDGEGEEYSERLMHSVSALARELGTDEKMRLCF